MTSATRRIVALQELVGAAATASTVAFDLPSKPWIVAVGRPDRFA